MHHRAFRENEIRFLLAKCLNKSISYRIHSHKYPLISNFDENSFLSLVDRHRVAPLIFNNLEDCDLCLTVLLSNLKSRAKANQIRSLLAIKFLIEFHDFMGSNEYDFMVLKGVSIAERYYGDIAQRDSIDIDILVDDSIIVPVSSWLRSKGYFTSLEIGQYNVAQIKFLKLTDHDLKFTSTSSDLPSIIELHWKIHNGLSKFSFMNLCNVTESVEWNILGRSFKSFSDVDNFLYLCVHGTEHAWFRLKWLIDLYQVIVKLKFEWDAVKKRAISLNCLLHVELSFILLKKYLFVEIPSTFSDSLNIDKYRLQLFLIEKSIFSKKGINDSALKRFQHFLYLYSLDYSNFSKRLFLRYLTNPRDWSILMLPKRLFFLYFPLRPFLWVSRIVLGIKQTSR